MPVAGNDRSQGASVVDQQIQSYRTRVSALRGNTAASNKLRPDEGGELTEALDIAEALLKMLDNRSNQADITAQGVGTSTGPVGL